MLMNQSLQIVPNHDRKELGKDLAASVTPVGKAQTA